MTKFIITVVILLVLLAGAIIMLDNVNVAKPTPTPTATVAASASTSPDYGIVGNIHVFSPKPAEDIGLPVIIKGEARTFEATFSYRIKNSKGDVLVLGHSMTTGTADYPDFRPFEVSSNYLEPKTATGSIEVFSLSAKDGSEINKVIVPVMFKKDVNAVSIKLYLDGKTATDWRIPKSDTPIRAMLDELLKVTGSTLVINSVTLKSGVLTVDLKGVLTADVKAQITKTAMQSSSVKSVVITVDGKTL